VCFLQIFKIRIALYENIPIIPWNSIFNFEALITKCPNIGDDIIKKHMNIPKFEKRPFKSDVEVSTLGYQVRQP
jgi:hypothetical protein